MCPLSPAIEELFCKEAIESNGFLYLTVVDYHDVQGSEIEF